ncbi:TetR/AcrR family transcriptional regulator [Humibacter ginsenosidimutans]|uniref:TetR family transcriptional regulator n=1 Tax=Humibacter ginsenosidimutans TaxID=2599293 RepID=A0A5B8M0T2_9MICO|nr:TetR family transcriptional regulator [Humibacter ginsenosidimutans]QDZ14428.1 TetR family transcriptional regulator [Humibacter ginsenosidimutans]
MTRMSVAERREALVAAALRVIARDGVHAATTRAIAGEAGMPQASFHYAFESRDELMREVVRHVVEQEEGSILPAMAPQSAPTDMRQALRSGLQHYFAGVTADPDHERAMFELSQYSQRTPGAEHLARLQYESYVELAVSSLTAAAQLVDSSWTRPIDEVARLLIGLTDGLTTTWLATRDDVAAQRFIDFAAEAVAQLSEPVRPAAGIRSAAENEVRA